MLEQESAKSKSESKAKRDVVQAEEERLVAGLPSNEAYLKEHLESVEKLVEKEQSRRTSVDARLMSIVGLTSIAATVVLTALFAMAAGTMPLPQGVSKWTLVLGCFYLALQLFAALYAAVKGLSRASYSSETAVDLLPPPKLARSNFLRQCISNKFDLLKQHQDVNNEKVSQMAVSHRAVLNFLVALVILAGAASLMALNREPPKEGGVCGEVLNKLCAAHDKSAPIATRKIVLTKAVTVEPFPPGEYKLNLDAVLPCVREVLRPYSDFHISGWQIIGRVDKHQLRAGSAAIYGSNQALAMARATWVRDNVLSQLKLFDPATAVMSVGGAINVGTKVGDSDLQSDRAVDIYVLLDQEVPQTSSIKLPAEPPTSIACPNLARKLD
ncbi:MAG: hypothetical protein Q8J80_04455 [Gallionella sp.]|nr:hypothetical protein [Gallionella sp.]